MSPPPSSRTGHVASRPAAALPTSPPPSHPHGPCHRASCSTTSPSPSHLPGHIAAPSQPHGLRHCVPRSCTATPPPPAAAHATSPCASQSHGTRRRPPPRRTGTVPPPPTRMRHVATPHPAARVTSSRHFGCMSHVTACIPGVCSTSPRLSHVHSLHRCPPPSCAPCTPRRHRSPRHTGHVTACLPGVLTTLLLPLQYWHLAHWL